MDIHKPKPIHGWRGLLSEIGIIVIGVLIALAAEQAADSLRWAHQVSEQKTLLKEELAGNGVSFFERLAVEGCLSARIKAIETALAKPGSAWRADDVLAGDSHREVYRAPWRSFPTQAWQNALTSGAASHMSREDLLGYQAVYADVADMHQMSIQEQLAREQLDELDQDGTLTDISRDRFRKALGELKFYAGGSARIADESLQQLKRMGLSPPPAELRKIVEEDAALLGPCVRAPAVL